MHKNTSALNDSKSVTTIVLSDHCFLLKVSNYGNLAALGLFLATFSLCMCRNGYLWVSSENFHTRIWFLDTNFLIRNNISEIWRCFLLILHSMFWMSTIPLLLVYLTYWPRKCLCVFLPSRWKFPPNLKLIRPSTAFLLLIHYLILWPRPLVTHGGSHSQPLHKVWSYYGYLFLSYEFWHYYTKHDLDHIG